ncbi:MAG: hypothetical protein VKS61_15520 [Candidatus Sericytochromatia bacterium]|nr:hypothetical protein [Candidatus Sericytochromatia bacterium]
MPTFRVFTFLAVLPLAAGPSLAAQGPQATCRSGEFSCTLPAPWQVRALPSMGKAPRLLRRWEFSRPIGGSEARISVELDRTEPLGKYPVRQGRETAARLAAAFSYEGYGWGDLRVKDAPGFYESWTAQLPGKPRFQVWAAHVFRRGARVRVGAVGDLGPAATIAQRDARSLLGSWTWAP